MTSRITSKLILLSERCCDAEDAHLKADADMCLDAEDADHRDERQHGSQRRTMQMQTMSVKKEDVGTKDDPSDEENKVKEEPATPCLDVPTAKRMALTPKPMALTPKPMTLTPKPPAMPPPSAYPWRQSADPVPPPQPGT